MKLRSLERSVLALGCAFLVYACSSDSEAPAPHGQPEAGAGGKGTGGKTETGGKQSTGGKASTGGKFGVQPEASVPDASPESGTEAGAGGSDGGGGTGGKSGTGGAGGAGGGTAGTDGGCGNPLQCLAKYPKVPYPAENVHTDKKAMLGKILFWEEQIGELGKNACGTCHRTESGGSDPRAADVAARQPGPNGVLETQPDMLSDDIRGGQGVPHCAVLVDGGAPTVTDTTVQVTQRKPPTYLDAMFALGVFWDGRAGYCAATNIVNGCFTDPDTGLVLIQGQIDPVTNRKVGGALEAQSVGPPVNSVEMACAGQTWPKIHAKLKDAVPLANAHARPQDMVDFIVSHNNSYPQMFADVYGTTNKVNSADSDDVINTRRIAFAIATHERRLTSDQTPWDKWNAGDDGALTTRQVQGFSLFMGKARCGTCHTPPLFADGLFHFIGFHDPNVTADTSGLKKITGNNADLGKFKTPTLRNVGLREPGGLLHSGDGPGHDLPTVMQLYTLGGLRSVSSIAPLIDQQMEVLQLDSAEIGAIIDFLRNGLTDPRVRDQLPPFDRPKLSTE